MLYRAEAAEAMKIDWMNRDEMCQAIPPAYTEYIGKYLMQAVSAHQGASQ
jgi:DNA (cytosine-5)-methyltransferase 1